MIPPQRQWAHQIAVTSMCWPHTGIDAQQTGQQSGEQSGQKRGQLTGCSNCTRLLAHEKKRYVMSPDQFEICAEAAKDFPYTSEPCPEGRQKVIGVFGGEPLLSPHFPQYVEILCSKIPDAKHRGLWTSLDWRVYSGPKYGPALPHVKKLLGIRDGHPLEIRQGYLNWNMHEITSQCEHQPLLVAIKDIVKSERRRWDLIEACWVQSKWSGAYALDAHGVPKFYFCEVASAFDRVFDLGTGIPVEPGCWRGDLSFVRDHDGIQRPVGKFARQIASTCDRCGASLPMPGRRDREWTDDVSHSNLVSLQLVDSPMVARGDYHEMTQQEGDYYDERSKQSPNQGAVGKWEPFRYIKRK